MQRLFKILDNNVSKQVKKLWPFVGMLFTEQMQTETRHCSILHRHHSVNIYNQEQIMKYIFDVGNALNSLGHMTTSEGTKNHLQSPSYATII